MHSVKANCALYILDLLILRLKSSHSDWLVGDNFLRSVYAIYDFGDQDAAGKVGNPYMKLLSLIDPDEASEDFAKIRGSQARTNITYTGLNGTTLQPSFALSTDANKTLDQLGKFIPIIMAIVALNAVVVIILAIGAIVYLCRRRSANNTARNPRGRASPLPLTPRNTYIAGLAPNQPHAYQPVSMALTEDTMFVPPSPAFHSDGSSLRPGDRPKSVA